MSYSDVRKQIEANQQKIASYGTFDAEVLKKINYKLRLDWNYYSNRMEGGTLTKAETRSVMVGNIDVKGKPFKDVAEMSGHDKVILEVLKMSKGETRIAEFRIKEIHKAIMYEDDSEKLAQVGQWKTTPNEIINYKNEKIAFSQPADVATEIHDLLNRTNAALDQLFNGKEEIDAVLLAAQFHIDYVSIHPFYDGNGRTSRILTNILLMACGYPAIIIKDEHKQAYYKLLGDIQAYGGAADLFHAFIAERILETQTLILDALEGKDIEEHDDIDKEIALWKQKLQSESLVLKRDNQLITQVYRNSIRPLIESFQKKHMQFDDLFTEKFLHITLDKIGQSVKDLSYLDQFFQFYEISDENEKSENDGLNERSKGYERIKTLKELNFEINYRGFKKNGINLFDERAQLHFTFEEFAYKVSVHRNQNVLLKKLYSEEITKSEITSIVKDQIKYLFENIKSSVERLNINNL